MNYLALSRINYTYIYIHCCTLKGVDMPSNAINFLYLRNIALNYHVLPWITLNDNCIKQPWISFNCIELPWIPLNYHILSRYICGNILHYLEITCINSNYPEFPWVTLNCQEIFLIIYKLPWINWNYLELLEIVLKWLELCFFPFNFIYLLTWITTNGLK